MLKTWLTIPGSLRDIRFHRHHCITIWGFIWWPTWRLETAKVPRPQWKLWWCCHGQNGGWCQWYAMITKLTKPKFNKAHAVVSFLFISLYPFVVLSTWRILLAFNPFNSSCRIFHPEPKNWPPERCRKNLLNSQRVSRFATLIYSKLMFGWCPFLIFLMCIQHFPSSPIMSFFILYRCFMVFPILFEVGYGTSTLSSLHQIFGWIFAVDVSSWCRHRRVWR